MKKQFTYTLPALGDSEFPGISRKHGVSISCEILPDNEVMILGNSAGLLYLARHLLAMALISNQEGLHIHLDSNYALDEGSSLLTICNSDFGFPGMAE